LPPFSLTIQVKVYEPMLRLAKPATCPSRFQWTRIETQGWKLEPLKTSRGLFWSLLQRHVYVTRCQNLSQPAPSPYNKKH